VTRMALREVAHARAGDKGDSSILVVAPFEAADFARLAALLTPARIAAHFGVADPGQVSVHAAPALAALSVVVRHRLAGGVTRSPLVDPHGKTLSGHLLDLVVEWEEGAR
jgi:hypothetical protein